MTAFTIDDITLVPRQGQLASRSHAGIHKFIYSAPMKTVTGYDLTKALVDKGYPVVSRFLDREELKRCVKDFGGHPFVFFAIGLDYENVFEVFHEVYPSFGKTFSIPAKVNVALDIAHGDMDEAHKLTYKLSGLPYIGNVMSGSICTPDAAIRAIGAGCTHLRVGVGCGAACTTRLQTGVGIPNAYAVESIFEVVDSGGVKNVQVIADGGIRYPGDAVKYLALGANGVMLGSLFSKCKESPGWSKNLFVKQYQGQASAAFQQDRYGRVSACPEGVEIPQQYQGHTVDKTVEMFEAGAASAVSYLGLREIAEINPANVDYMMITQAAQREAQPHGLTTTYAI